MSIRYLLAGAALLGLSACGPYREAPSVSAYFSKVPSAEVKATVSMVGVCFERLEWREDGQWLATVVMGDEASYHYQLNVAKEQAELPVKLISMDTASQREDMGGQAAESCLRSTMPFYFKNSKSGEGLEAYVHDKTALYNAFDEQTKSVLRRALQAAQAAAEAHKNYQPPEKSWGLKD